MQIKVNFLDNLRLEAEFDDYTVISDQPVRYKGDATAPGPFDYFLASSAMCAAYFVKAYCLARDIPTGDIQIIQNNVVDPENRYRHSLQISAVLPDHLSEKDRKGIVSAMDRCSVKRVIQNSPVFEVKATQGQEQLSLSNLLPAIDDHKSTMMTGKDQPLEKTLSQMYSCLEGLGVKIEISSWRNIVPNVWSVNVCDADSPMCFTNGKGATKEAALCSALGEYLERLSNNYFYNDYYLGQKISDSAFVHSPDEKWFLPEKDDKLPSQVLDENMRKIYQAEEPLKASHLVDTNSDSSSRGVCALSFVRQSDGVEVYIPVNLIGNLFVSNGMSAGNNSTEAKVQSLCEILERGVKNKIITEEIALPDVPEAVVKRFPRIATGVEALEKQGFPILVKDASLGGEFPVLCIVLLNPKTGGVFASFGSHPCFEVALERCLTELMQGRSFQGMDDMPLPTFNSFAINEPNNIVEHFVDSTGVISWKFFSDRSRYSFKDWNFQGSVKEELEYLYGLFQKMNKEVYVLESKDTGFATCRILVPGYSEIYPIQDLIWNNNNKGSFFRSSILKLHQLCDTELRTLVDNLESTDWDDYMPVGDFIGIAFDENTAWGRCTLGELKAFVHLALRNYESAKIYIEALNNYNDNSPSRRLFFQALGVVLEIYTNPSLNFSDYKTNLVKMYGRERVKAIKDSCDGQTRFYGLPSLIEDIFKKGKHFQLMQSYHKIHKARFNLSKK